MDEPLTTAERLECVDRVIAAPPVVHPGAPDGAAWSTGTACYRFMAGQVSKGSRTLETGAGLSTVLFAAWGCDHLAVVPSPEEAGAIERYCDQHSISRASLTFDLRPSEVALPTLAAREFDLVFIDGCHGFPLPTIDWFYGAGLLRRGGIVVFDDLQLPQVSSLIATFVDPDPRWEAVATTAKWRAFRRTSDGPLAEQHSDQPFFPTPPPGAVRRAKDLVPLSLKKWYRRI